MTTSSKTVADAVRRGIQHNRKTRCLLCGRRAWVGAFFIPRDQKRVGAPAGKVRTIAYSLCKRCYRVPGVQDRVEKRIFGDLDAAARVN